MLERASGYFPILFVHSITDGRVYIFGTRFPISNAIRCLSLSDLCVSSVIGSCNYSKILWYLYLYYTFLRMNVKRTSKTSYFNVALQRVSLRDVNFWHFRQVLQRDIEAHGRIVSSVVKLGDKVYNQQQGEQQEQGQKGEERQEQQEQREPSQVLRTVKSLERRWHLLFLRALEWQCHIETLVSRVSSKVSFFLFLNYSCCTVYFALHAFVNTKDENGASNK